MNDARKTKTQLINELAELRRKVTALESADAERKRVEEALRESEELHRITMENILDPVFITDDAGRFTFICPNIPHILGYSIHEVQQMGNIAQIVGPDLFQQEELKTRGEVRNIERVIVEKDGGERIFLITVKRVAIQGGSVLYACHDITERKRTEEALRMSEQLFRLSLKNAPVTIAAQDLRLRFLSAYNQRTVDPAAIIGKTDTDLFIPADAERLIALKRRVLESGQELHTEIWLTRSGKSMYLDLFIEPLRDDTGTMTGIGIATVDLTPIKITEEALRESELRYRTVFEQAPIGILSYDANTVITSCNQRLADIMEISREHILGVNILATVKNPQQKDALLKALAGRIGVFEGDYTFVISGETRIIRSTYAPFLAADGLVEGGMCITEDITDRKRAESQIREHNWLLEQAVQQKQQEMEVLFERLLRQEKLATIGQMAGSIAHELRNPLGAVKQSVYYLKRLAQTQELTAFNPKALRHLDLMDTELDTTERVIADLLDMTRLKPPQRQLTDLRTILADAVMRSQVPARVHVNTTLKPDSFQIDADPLQLRQVMLNVLSNAVQAIEGEGVITIHATQVTENQECVITISDTGIGIAPETLNRVFEPLYTTKATGTGLGLSICKQIIESHQGRISLTSQPGQDTTVMIVLPWNERCDA